MRRILKVLALFLGLFALYLVFYGCSPSDEQNNDATDSLSQQIDSTQAFAPVRESSETEMLSIAQTIDEEKERYIDDNGYLCINLLESKVPKDQTQAILKKLFPQSEVQVAEESKTYHAYNIQLDSINYSAVSVFEDVEQQQVLGFLFVAKGAFKKEILGNLFS